MSEKYALPKKLPLADCNLIELDAPWFAFPRTNDLLPLRKEARIRKNHEDQKRLLAVWTDLLQYVEVALYSSDLDPRWIKAMDHGFLEVEKSGFRIKYCFGQMGDFLLPSRQVRIYPENFSREERAEVDGLGTVGCREEGLGADLVPQQD